MLNVITVSEAQQLIAEKFGQLRMPEEQVLLEGALARVLARDCVATEFVPDFNRSTVDGYAVRAQDVFGCSDSIPALLMQIGEAHMGEHTTLTIHSGECVYVPTGAEIPAGADCVITLEDTEPLGDGTIAVYKPVPPGTNLIFRGDDVKPGDLVLPAGRRLNVADIGALAALGQTSVSVRQAPRIAVISTGDEIVAPGEPLPMGKIRDVNAPMLL
ncbi:MAG TPA: molybdopterin molybdotransferase MoeA, partial [Anaerolineaceae bacterium]|nr:molybdopterin molybdotransferase MoeA [Anaerolineaceae bacterium]